MLNLDPSWVGVVGVVAGAVIGGALGIAGPWITHKARSDPLREELYRRQMDAIDALLELIQVAYHDALKRTFAQAADRPSLSEVVFMNDERWVQAMIKRGHYLPNSLLTALNKFRVAMLNAALTPPIGIYPTNGVDDAYTEVSREIRATVGVDAMSDELGKLFRPQRSDDRMKSLRGDRG